MKVVGIKQLKAWLSEYVRLAKAGATVLVTERDEVVAELRPARRQTPVADRLEEVLEGLAAAGEMTRAAQAAAVWVCRPARHRPCSTNCAGTILTPIMAAAALYLDTSVTLRATLDRRLEDAASSA